MATTWGKGCAPVLQWNFAHLCTPLTRSGEKEMSRSRQPRGFIKYRVCPSLAGAVQWQLGRKINALLTGQRSYPKFAYL